MTAYETAKMNKNTRSLRELIEEVRQLPAGTTVYDDYTAGTKTIVYKDGRKVIRSIGSKVKPSASKGSAIASLKETVRKADENISDFIRRIAQLDVEISRKTMRGEYTGGLKNQRADLLQRISQLEAIKKRCAALIG